MVSSPKPALKAENKDRGNQEESAHAKTKRKRAQGTEEGSGTPAQSTVLDESLVGSRIKVWWPDDKAFYDGVVDSFDPVSKKHKVLYDDGDIEVLLLKNERWKLVRIDGGLAKDISGLDASSELRQDKKAKTSSSSVSKHSKMETPVKSVVSSGVARRKGRPRGGITNPGKLTSDYSPKTSGKSKEKDASKHDDDIPKTGGRIKKDTGSKSKDDTLKTGDRSTDETYKIDSKSRDDTQKAGSKSRVDVPKSSRKLKSEDDMISTGGRAKKEAVKGKSSEETPRSGRKSSEETPRSGRKSRGESRANGTSEKGKSKAEEIETSSGKVQSDSVKVQESEASTGKKRKRKGQS